MVKLDDGREVYGVIYKITNLVNGKVYIGQTTQRNGFNGRYVGAGEGIERVFNHYKNHKDKGLVYNNHLFNAIIKYGLGDFAVEKVFEICEDKKSLDEREVFWINEYKSSFPEHGYNKTSGGGNGKRTLETRIKRTKQCRKVIIVEDNIIFNNHLEASDYMNVKYGKFISTDRVIEMCKSNKITNFRGTDLKLTFRFLWEYVLEKDFNDNKNVKGSSVIRLADGKVWSGASKASRESGDSLRSIDYSIREGRGRKNRNKTYMYFKDYINCEVNLGEINGVFSTNYHLYGLREEFHNGN